MTGEEFYNKYKNKFIEAEGKRGIVIGFSSYFGIISVKCGVGWSRSNNHLPFYFSDDGNNLLGYWAVCEYNLFKVFTFKFGRHNEWRRILY